MSNTYPTPAYLQEITEKAIKIKHEQALAELHQLFKDIEIAAKEGLFEYKVKTTEIEITEHHINALRNLGFFVRTNERMIYTNPDNNNNNNNNNLLSSDIVKLYINWDENVIKGV